MHTQQEIISNQEETIEKLNKKGPEIVNLLFEPSLNFIFLFLIWFKQYPKCLYTC